MFSSPQTPLVGLAICLYTSEHFFPNYRLRKVAKFEFFKVVGAGLVLKCWKVVQNGVDNVRKY